MYGVVLWSSKEEDRAVIWCEDHGDLAFYDGSGESVFDGISLDAGDLVSFTVNEGREMRLATNPRLVAEQQYPGLADRLMSDGSMPRRPAAEAARPAGQGQGGENVIAFAPRHQAARLAS